MPDPERPGRAEGDPERPERAEPDPERPERAEPDSERPVRAAPDPERLERARSGPALPLIEAYLADLAAALGARRPAHLRILAEAADHLHLATAQALADGLPLEAAQRQAIDRFGPAAVVAAAFVRSPRRPRVFDARRGLPAAAVGDLQRAVSLALAAHSPWLAVLGYWVPEAPGPDDPDVLDNTPSDAPNDAVSDARDSAAAALPGDALPASPADTALEVPSGAPAAMPGDAGVDAPGETDADAMGAPAAETPGQAVPEVAADAASLRFGAILLRSWSPLPLDQPPLLVRSLGRLQTWRSGLLAWARPGMHLQVQHWDGEWRLWYDLPLSATTTPPPPREAALPAGAVARAMGPRIPHPTPARRCIRLTRAEPRPAR